MAHETPAVTGSDSAAGHHKIALFGTGISLRLAEKLPGFINAEPAPSLASEALCLRYGYRGFSARTGEIANLAGLRQLFSAALTETPVAAWQRTDGRFSDPLRPRVDPEGLSSAEEVAEMQEQHLLAVRQAIGIADEVLLVLGGAAHGRDKASGAIWTSVPDTTFPSELRARIEPYFSGFNELENDFAEIWRLLQDANPGVKITVALAPPMPGETLAREEQHQLTCLRVLAEEWAWRFANVGYLPIWDLALARGSEDSFALAEILIAQASPPTEAESASSASSDDNDDADIDTASDKEDPPPSDEDQNARRRKKRKNRAAPSTVCEDELLEAFSR
ncbi:GSCFA domain-containing protein [Paracoccus aerodenitrificans]|uniref:GSCFA domain-containing protein n=1 Tax=Paracoccus aerodenitrificans TaxID=3017781 RepID=UPI0022F007A5|nr:GSCFA domain-containing protein [Paracoccus aerodenitrificans]WBU63537.1 GSCFA domain-containing protein [Paracoccus aerodenitrificans]